MRVLECSTRAMMVAMPSMATSDQGGACMRACVCWPQRQLFLVPPKDETGASGSKLKRASVIAHQAQLRTCINPELCTVCITVAGPVLTETHAHPA